MEKPISSDAKLDDEKTLISRLLADLGGGMTFKSEFLIVSFVTKPDQHAEMRKSFEAAGFNEASTRYLILDNTSTNAHDPFRVIPEIVASAQADFVVFMHQDVLANQGDGVTQLRAQLAEITSRDPNWAIAANCGVDSNLLWHAHYTDPYVTNMRLGALPSRVCSVDEHFFVVRQAATVETSRSLAGFHLYATDLCLHALRRGFSCWAIDFHVQHLGGTLKDEDMAPHKRRLANAWNDAFDIRFLRTTCFTLLLSRSRFWRKVLGHPKISRLMMRDPRRYFFLRGVLRTMRVVGPHWLDLGKGANKKA